MPAPKTPDFQVSTFTGVVEHSLVCKSGKLGLLEDVEVLVLLRVYIRCGGDPELIHSWVCPLSQATSQQMLSDDQRLDRLQELGSR